jgi:hypothetical protein
MPQLDLNQSYTDDLSPLTLSILKLNLSDAYSRLVVAGGDGPSEAGDLLGSASPEQLLSGAIVSLEDARGLLAGLWLWHDFLDESHEISQRIASATGSFWHAILHRREGDFSNSKYWYAKCRNHPVLGAIYGQANGLIHPLPADKALLKLVNGSWDAFAFVDLVEEVYEKPGDPRREIAVSLQQMEWRALFDYCARQACGR